VDLKHCPGKKYGMRNHNTAYPDLSIGLQLNTVSTGEFPTYPQVYETHLKLPKDIVGNQCFVKDDKEEVEDNVVNPIQSPHMARFRRFLRLYRVQEGWGQGMTDIPIKHDGYSSSTVDTRKLVSVRKDDEGMEHVTAASQSPLHLSHLKCAQGGRIGKEGER